MTKRIIGFIDSRNLFWIVIVLFVIQALWIASSFKSPMIYDEATHLAVIEAYSHQWSPYLENPAPTIPFHYSIYHYIMSFPYRLVLTFTDNFAIQVVFLRLINIVMAATGLLIFASLLKQLRIRWSHINVGLFVYAMLPISSLVAATVNYDNLLFLLAPIYIFFCLRIFQNKKVNWHDYAGALAVGALASLIKYIFLPIFAVTVAGLVIVVVRRFGIRGLTKGLVVSFRKTITWLKYLTLTVSVLVFGIFSLEYVYNVIKFGSPQPSCFQVLDQETCFSSSLVQRGIRAKATVHERPVVPLPEYTQMWVVNMVRTTVFSGNSASKGNIEFQAPLPIMYIILFFGAITALGVLLFAWRGMGASKAWYFLMGIVVVLFLSVYLVNVRSYYENHAVFANQPRYLLTLLPILLVMVASATDYILGVRRWLKIGLLAILLLAFTQGGGAITHLLRSERDWYWDNDTIIEVNETTKSVIAPLVIE